jgi:hypothetical protein
MHLSLRQIQESGPELYALAEEAQVRQLLSSGPDVVLVKVVNRHPKGDYSGTLEYAGEDLEPLVSYILSCGFRGVL